MNPILTQGFGHKLLKSNSMVWENILLIVLFGFLSVFGNTKSLLICFRELFNAGERIFQFVLLFKRYKTCFVTCSFSFHKKTSTFCGLHCCSMSLGKSNPQVPAASFSSLPQQTFLPVISRPLQGGGGVGVGGWVG